MIQISRYSKFLLSLIFALIFLNLTSCSSDKLEAPIIQSEAKPLTVLISLDGFKPEYLNRNSSPNLNQLAENGAIAKGLISTFPSVTFPNHYSIVTGLYPDHHGIVNNTMFDSQIKEVFKLSSREAVTNPAWWSDAKPIWVSVIEQDKKASTLFWPGTETKINQIQPNDWLNYDHNMSSTARVDQLLTWLNRPNNSRADFATLYFSEVDSAGHSYGPNSKEVNQAVSNVDMAIGRFITGLKNIGLNQKTTFIIVADHGMSEVPKDNWLEISSVLKDIPGIKYEWTGPVAGINVEEKYVTNVLQSLNKISHMECWKKSEIPAKFHFGSHRRIPNVVCLAENHFVITDKKPLITYPGHHGFDPQVEDMHGLFIASGYQIKKAQLGYFENIDVYPLMAKLLNIRPEKNDASDHLIKKIVQ
jgi:predicted AlkP superfamily pyrophosphatase or phosphodiesterase